MSDKQNHKKWRKEFREGCLERDGNKCVFCDITENLDVHHITDRHDLPNGGYVLSNGITLCNHHHLLCEEWHRGGVCEIGYQPNDLYEIINSSYEQAYNDSKNLKDEEE